MGVKIKPKKKEQTPEQKAAARKADIVKKAKARLAKEKSAQAEEQGYRSVKALDKQRVKDVAKVSKREERTKRIAIRQGEKTERVKARNSPAKAFKYSGTSPAMRKLSSSCKAAARAKFDVYPSAYANMWASKQQGKGKC
tara:strand:- start:144 stop:563 length:420 start_codon:yes stop_codon:yes gene_type:complete